MIRHFAFFTSLLLSLLTNAHAVPKAAESIDDNVTAGSVIIPASASGTNKPAIPNNTPATSKQVPVKARGAAAKQSAPTVKKSKGTPTKAASDNKSRKHR